MQNVLRVFLRLTPYATPKSLFQALIGLAWTGLVLLWGAGPEFDWGAGRLAPSPVALGFHSASHCFIDASAAFWTVAMVGSTNPEAVDKSEQWNPSPKPIGCCGVLRTLRPSAEMVASLHGSPGYSKIAKRDIKIRGRIDFLTHSICEEDVLDPDIPALVDFIGSFSVDFGWLREGVWEHELALPL